MSFMSYVSARPGLSPPPVPRPGSRVAGSSGVGRHHFPSDKQSRPEAIRDLFVDSQTKGDT